MTTIQYVHATTVWPLRIVFTKVCICIWASQLINRLFFSMAQHYPYVNMVFPYLHNIKELLQIVKEKLQVKQCTICRKKQIDKYVYHNYLLLNSNIINGIVNQWPPKTNINNRWAKRARKKRKQYVKNHSTALLLHS